MEKRLVTAHQGHLPCMTTRTNLSADILNGTDGTIAFEVSQTYTITWVAGVTSS